MWTQQSTTKQKHIHTYSKENQRKSSLNYSQLAGVRSFNIHALVFYIHTHSIFNSSWVQKKCTTSRTFPQMTTKLSWMSSSKHFQPQNGAMRSVCVEGVGVLRQPPQLVKHSSHFVHWEMSLSAQLENGCGCFSKICSLLGFLSPHPTSLSETAL